LEGGNAVLATESVKFRKSNRPKTLTKKERKAQGVGKDYGKATLMYSSVSASKIKIVADLIKGKNVVEAMAILRFTPKSASELLIKILKSAVANAENNNNMDPEKLYVTEAYANQGPTAKRIQPRAQGRAYRILKRTSHITVVVKEKE